MALFKVSKGLAKNLITNVPNAKEGFAYFTSDDGKFYIDISGDGTSATKAVIGTNRIPLNAYASDVLKASSMPTNDNIVYPILAFSLKDSTKDLIEAKYTQIGIKNGSLVIPNVVGKDEILISNTGAGRGIVIDNTNGTGHAIEITAGKGIKVAKDPVDNLELATKQYVDKILSANDAMIFKGILDNTHNLPDTHETGWTYRVNKAGTYAGKVCEIGDLVICIADGLSANDSHWTVAQTNIDGAVIGPNASTVNAVSTFADATGKIIKDNPKVTIDNTGLFTAPYIATGTNKTHYFQSKKFRSEGNADTYYHAIDFGYSGHDQVDFHEYGGIWNFYRNTKGTAADGKLVASIQPNGFHGNLNGNATTATTATKAGSADKVNNNLVIKLNSGTTEGTNQFTYNGSAAKDINITPANIGAASNSHNHDSSYVKKSGDIMTGDLKFQKTNSDGTTSITATIGATTGYVTGTWLQTTSVGNKVGDFATIDSSGWIYKRTAAQARQDMGLSTAMHFIGKATVDITDGSTIDPKITGYTAKTAGDVIIDKSNSYEYVWTLEGKWERLGPDGSYSVVGHMHDDRYVIKSGDTMSGDLTLNKKLIANNLIVLKNGQTYGTSTPANGTTGQLFFAQDTSDSDYLPLTGGTLSGNLTLNEKLLITNKMYGATKPSNPVEGQIFFQENDGSLALPAGGTAGQYLVKNSSNDSDASWKSLPALNYLPLSGGTLTGNLTISHSDTNDATVRVTNSKGSIGLLSSTNRGLYDYTKSKWLIYTDGTKASTSYALYGAVWNDYAEFREGDTIDAGRCVVEVGDDTLITSTERMMPGANITSDTFGFAIGETEQAKTPIAVSGRVLAYPYESREEFKKNVGRPVCSGPNGTVSIMTDEEYRSKGYCAIGTISAVPDYEEWGTGKVKVNGRVWIKV